MLCVMNVLLVITITVAQDYQATHGKYAELSSHHARQNITEVNLNNFFDRRLPFIRRVILKNGLDPMKLPDAKFPLPSRLLMNGEVYIQKGWLDHLSTIQRAGDIIFRYNQNEVLELNLNLGWDRLHVNYAYALTYIFGTRKGDVYGHLNNLQFMIRGSMDFKNYELKFNAFKFLDIGNFSLKLKGHLTDHVLNTITRVITKFGKKQIIPQIERHLSQLIQDKVDEINLLLHTL